MSPTCHLNVFTNEVTLTLPWQQCLQCKGGTCMLKWFGLFFVVEGKNSGVSFRFVCTHMHMDVLSLSLPHTHPQTHTHTHTPTNTHRHTHTHSHKVSPRLYTYCLYSHFSLKINLWNSFLCRLYADPWRASEALKWWHHRSTLNAFNELISHWYALRWYEGLVLRVIKGMLVFSTAVQIKCEIAFNQQLYDQESFVKQ